MPVPPFAVTFDYRCPFARNVHEHLVAGLGAGAGWDVEFLPFSLSQAKVEAGGTDVWTEPGSDSGLLALQVGVAVRDTQPDRFLATHEALFALRHDRAGNLRDEAALRATLDDAGADADAAFAEVASGRALAAVRADHERAVREHEVWGVPTFVAQGQSAFVRLMNRPERPQLAIEAVERIVDLLTTWPDLNEFKHSSLPR